MRNSISAPNRRFLALKASQQRIHEMNGLGNLIG